MRHLISTALSSALAAALAAATCLLAPATAFAQGFAAYVSPPRFEIGIQAAQRSRQVVEIQHVGRQDGRYRFYTADWTLGPDYSVNFQPELAEGSCRPWVAIERKELTLKPGDKYRYRFEISPPAGTPARECRFALMIEGLDPAKVDGPVSFPVSGRIGVIVYARMGDAAPVLEPLTTQVATVNGQPTMVIGIRNSGNAHGRLAGFLNAVDATGQQVEMAPADLPILPGETRQIPVTPVPGTDGRPAPTVKFPLKVSGALEWEGGKLPVETTLTLQP